MKETIKPKEIDDSEAIKSLTLEILAIGEKATPDQAYTTKLDNGKSFSAAYKPPYFKAQISGHDLSIFSVEKIPQQGLREYDNQPYNIDTAFIRWSTGIGKPPSTIAFSLDQIAERPDKLRFYPRGDISRFTYPPNTSERERKKINKEIFSMLGQVKQTLHTLLK